MTLVVNRHTHTKTPLDVYIGRGSIWGNQFSHREGTKAVFVVASVQEAVDAHRVSLWSQIRHGEITLGQLAALDGKTLVCFCSSPDRPRPCHGHTLAKAAAWARAELDAQEYDERCRRECGVGAYDVDPSPEAPGEDEPKCGGCGRCDNCNGTWPTLGQDDQPACRTCWDTGRVRSTAMAVPGHVWSAQPCPSCRPGVPDSEAYSYDLNPSAADLAAETAYFNSKGV